MVCRVRVVYCTVRGELSVSEEARSPVVPPAGGEDDGPVKSAKDEDPTFFRLPSFFFLRPRKYFNSDF